MCILFATNNVGRLCIHGHYIIPDSLAKWLPSLSERATWAATTHKARKHHLQIRVSRRTPHTRPPLTSPPLSFVSLLKYTTIHSCIAVEYVIVASMSILLGLNRFPLLVLLSHILLTVWGSPTPPSQAILRASGRNNGNSSVSVALFRELEELARIVDIAYCVGTAGLGIQKPFQCASRCSEFENFELVTVCQLPE